MSDLRSLYQELIIDHGRHPRNFKPMPEANSIKEGFNPLCGDRLTLYLRIDNEIIVDATFEGAGCAISMASTSLMTQIFKGKTLSEAQSLFNLFHQMVTKSDSDCDIEALGKLAVLKGVCEFPARVKCASLAWHTAMAAIENKTGDVTTE